MPCTGPSEASPAEVDKVYEDVLTLLKEKHKISHTFGKESFFTGLRESRTEAFKNLHRAIEDILTQESYEGW